MAPDPADDPDLRARVEQLEATVEAQQATIEQLLPSRRRVLQAGGLVAGGGVLGALSADRASAQASGQVGTSSDPVDVEAYDLAVQNELSSSVDAGGNDLTNVGSVKTGEQIITGDVDSVTLPLLSASDASGFDIRYQETASVGTSATEIFAYGARGGRITVVAESGTFGFVDELLFHRRGDTVTRINSLDISGPPSRSYTSSSGFISLSLSSGSIPVVTYGVRMKEP